MVVVDTPQVSNENINVKEEVVKCQKEVKILNSDGTSSSVDELTKCMTGLSVDPTEAVRQEFRRLEVKERRKDDNSDDEGVTIYGDHREEEEDLVGRGPPGIPVESSCYAGCSEVQNLASDIKRQKGKRGHNEAMDPLSKGFRPNLPQTLTDFSNIAQNQLSGGSLKCSQQRQGKPTVKELLAEREQQQLQQQLFMQHFPQMVTMPTGDQAQHVFPTVTSTLTPAQPPLNIPLDGDEGLPSFDIDDLLKTVEESEKMTGLYNEPPTIPDTRPQLESMRRVRNQPSMSESSISDPRSPESGYHTSSPAPSSPPRSPSSRPPSFEDEYKLAKELDDELDLVVDYLKEKEIEGKQKNQPHENQAPQVNPLQPSWQVPTQVAMPPVTQAVFIPPAVQAQAPNAQFVVVGVPNIIPAQVPRQATPGKGRPPNSSKGRQTVPGRQRAILPKPGPSMTTPTIPTTVTAAQRSIQVPNVNSMAQSVLPAQSNCDIVHQQQQKPRAEPTKFMPIAPKKEDPLNVQRGDPLMKRTMPDVLTDTKMKIRAHRQIVGKPLEEILKVDADGDMWIHSYIMYLNENKDALYMINAIIQRLKREHKESNINIKQVINTQNNHHQTPVYLATVMNNQYVLDWLLKAGGDPNIMASTSAPSGTLRKGPLHYAASRGDECLDVLYVLLECRDTDINLKNTDGLSPIHVAVKSHGKPIPNSTQEINSTRVIEALIQKGANLEEVDDKNGKSPIHNLVECQSYELISAIFNVIPEPDLKKYLRKIDFQKNTALHTAAQCAMSNKDEHKKIIKLLLEKGADPLMKNAENHTANMLAYKPHREELVPLLKAAHGKNIHNPMSPPHNNNAALKAVKKPPTATTMNTQPTYIVLGTLPAATTAIVGQPLQSQVPIVTLPQNAVLSTQTVNCGNQVTYAQIPQQSHQMAVQNSYSTPINSPQMFQIGSPQMAQSPPQVQSPQMLQAHHDLSMSSPLGPTSPPQQAATTFIPTQPNNMYHYSNSVH